MRVRRLCGAARREDGQSVIEFAILAPILLVLFMGIVEAGTAYDRQHALESLSREGANLASRGTDMEKVVDVIEANGSAIGLAELGGAVVTRVRIVDEVPEIVEQVGSPGYVERSRVGAVGEVAQDLDGIGLVEGQSVHVVELFYRYDSFTPLGSFVRGAIPQGLYSRAVF